MFYTIIITSFDLEVGESEALEPSPQLDLQEFSELDIQENADSTLEISENQLDNNDVAKKEPDSLQIVGDDLVASQQLDQSIQEESKPLGVRLPLLLLRDFAMGC